jgi:hypothetical protein
MITTTEASNFKTGCIGCLSIIVIVAVIIAIVMAVTGGGHKATVAEQARSYVDKNGPDVKRVQANVVTVQVMTGLAQKAPTQANVNGLAQRAQQAHDNLDSLRYNLTSDFPGGALGDAELSVFSGTNDLRDAMSALVTYTGTPNAATLAQFTTKYQSAVAEWNSGVRTIWKLANTPKPPTL